MYTENDAKREVSTEEIDYRSPYRRDYARLIHSPSFRRLQGKTQLYPGVESDFFRNRLTHSLEVAQISKTIGHYINNIFININDEKIDLDLCEFAGIAHDLGHPPFGHQGEEALDECMREDGGFEGNAQTLRILSKIEKKVKKVIEPSRGQEYRAGLNLTYRSIASILKYDNEIPSVSDERHEDDKNHAVKGYYVTEAELVGKVKEMVAPGSTDKFKSVECQIMDIADDIAYSTYDLEDGFKAGFYHPMAFFSYPKNVLENVAKKVGKALKKDEHCKRDSFEAEEVNEVLFGIFSDIYNFEEEELDVYKDKNKDLYIKIRKNSSKEAFLADIVNHVFDASKSLTEDGYLRSAFTSELINKAIDGVKFELNKENPALSKVYLEEKTRIKVEVLKNFTYESQILSPRLKIAEFRGKDIVKTIFEAIAGQEEGWRLMPTDYQQIYQHFTEASDRRRCICDFIAGMTDKYAIEFYGRLKSENPETIFKPF